MRRHALQVLPSDLAPEPIEIVVKGRVDGKRLDAWLTARFPDYSRSIIQKVIDAEAVFVNGRPARASARIREGDTISVRLPELHDPTPQPEEIPLSIIYEDEALVVIDKAPGLVVHPAKGHWSGTVVNALQFHFDRLSSVGGAHRPGIVHRLDRDTSGLLVVVKDDSAHGRIAQQFEARTIKKEYLAIVAGNPPRDSDYIERPIGPHPTHREKMAIRIEADGGKEAVTFYQVVERFAGYALLRCLPRTGRTHQIRVHLTHAGLPILADKLYSGRDRITRGDLAPPGLPRVVGGEALIERQALHAHRLTLEHPNTGATIDLTAPIPADMAAVLEELRANRLRPPPDHRPGISGFRGPGER